MGYSLVLLFLLRSLLTATSPNTSPPGFLVDIPGLLDISGNLGTCTGKTSATQLLSDE